MKEHEQAKTYRFYKTPGGSWYIDLPEWTGALAELQMVAGADTLLDELSGGNNEVFVEIALHPINGFDELQLVTKSSFGGADYIFEKLQR
jgi:hypothetical protein